MRLENKIAVVTGGNSGIGFATARRFLDEGAKVVIIGRREDAVQKAARELGDGVVGLTADASDIEKTTQALEEVKHRFDRIDILFLNAGVAPISPISEQSVKDFDSLIDVNFKGPYFTIQKALPLLSEGASIIFNTSVANVSGLPGMSVYSATKAALRSLTRTLAAELADRKIRVNSLSPGVITTPLFDKLGLPKQESDAFLEMVGPQIPLGRFGRPEEMAGVAAFLASDDASYVTGTEIAADGGFSQV